MHNTIEEEDEDKEVVVTVIAKFVVLETIMK